MNRDQPHQKFPPLSICQKRVSDCVPVPENIGRDLLLGIASEECFWTKAKESYSQLYP